MKVIILILVVCVSFSTSALPEYLKVCPLNLENYSDCVISSIANLRNYLKDGIKEFNVPPMEPFVIDRFSFGGKDGNRLFATNMTNIKLTGISTYKILKLVHTPTKKGHTFRIEATIPKMQAAGDYEINTRLANTDLHGKGPFTVDISDYHFECIFKGKKTDVAGKTHLKFGLAQCNSVVGKTSIYMHNLFGGNLVLEKAANEAISQNAESLYEEFRPSISNIIRSKITESANAITMSFTYDELFPST